MSEVRVLFLTAVEVKRNREDILNRIGSAQREKALSYKRESDRLLSMGSSYLKMKLAGAPENIRTGPYGKPYGETGYFNLSHSEDLIGIALCEDAEIGLDIEKVREMPKGFEEYCLSKEELNSGMDLLRVFVAKESLAKAEGSGLPDEIKEVPGIPVNGKIIYRIIPYMRHECERPGYWVSVSVKENDFTIKEENYEIR